MAKTVLVCDDVDFVRKTIKDIMIQAHYQVVGEAKTGQEAFEQYFRLKPDIVTMDVVMPEMSGIEATRKILKKDKEAKIIIVSALGHENMVMEAVIAGARDYILKPFTSKDILNTVNHILVEPSQDKAG